MDNRVLVDTSYWLALELARDQYHQAAIDHWRDVALLPTPLTLVTTSFIFAEVVAYMSSHGFHRKAVQFGNNLMQDPFVQFIHIDAGLLHDAWSYFQRHDDKDYSLTDCVSFVLMRNMGITAAFTFDRHFEQAGFIRQPL